MNIEGTSKPLNRLRSATKSLHQQLEATPFVAALESGEASKSSYAGFLRVMALLHAAVDRACQLSSDPAIHALGASSGRRGQQATRDLNVLNLPSASDRAASTVPMQHALIAANDVLWKGLDDPDALIGALYVIQGSRHGARQLSAMVSNRFGADVPMGFWTSGTEGFSEAWKQFLVAVDRCPEEAVGGACELASLLFEQLTRSLGALHPPRQDADPPAAMINPDAGTHPIPDDPRVIVASIMAAQRSWKRYPYFEARWGERGRRFGSSDSAWLATLVDEPETVMQGQVDWLAGVLASRGMPTLLLEDHVRWLGEELVSFACVDKDAGLRLAAIADELKMRRVSHLGDDAVLDLAKLLRERAPGDPPVSHVPELIAGAVADECEGMDQAVPSLIAWLADETRHGANWASAVRAGVDKARRLMIS